MQTIQIKTAEKVVPMIYAYTTPEIARHNGWTKIGYTEQDINKRLKQQMGTPDVKWNIEWKGTAIFDDGSGEVFRDTDFHAYLSKQGIERQDKTEWFHISGKDSKDDFHDFKENRGVLDTIDTVVPYKLRKEQALAVEQTKAYFTSLKGKEYLWNAKPRFGKTLAVYDLCKNLKAKNVLIVTNRPAIANSWYDDYVRFMGDESGFKFVSSTDSLKGKPYVISREDYLTYNLNHADAPMNCIEFLSLQDLKGAISFGGKFDKLEELAAINWDILVIDEAHEGVDTYKTDVAFDQIKRKYTLHLSGTPFKALANDKFPTDAIFNWTYADEQETKRNWDMAKEEENPYFNLPKLNMFTYQMSEIVKDEIKQGVEIKGQTEEYAFDLNVFFETKDGKFVYESSVDKFLDALTKQPKFPFSTEKLRNELKHTFWLLNRVESAKALAKKLEEHPVFKDYKIILAAGDGRIDDTEEIQKSYDKVIDAIKKYDKTITISVGQLTTGVTIPEWTGVLMLSNIKSPALYMQAAFRAQNPCLFNDGKGQFLRKENAYVFDFDPARTLIIYESFANDLSSDTTNGHGDGETRKKHIRKLLNFFPVFGEDETGEMVELDAEKVLSIPRKIKSKEVVKRGFMSDYLFQNISNVFHAPQAVLDMITSFEPVKEPSKKAEVTTETEDELNLDGNGEVNLDEGYVIGKSTDVFGDKIFGDDLGDMTDLVVADDKDEWNIERLKQAIQETTVKPIIAKAKESYGSEMKPSDKNEIERTLTHKTDEIVKKEFGTYSITAKKIENEREKALNNLEDTGKTEKEINKEFDKKQAEAATSLQEKLQDSIKEFAENAKIETVKTVETNKKEREKQGLEDRIKDHLRGFSRTIPSFLMAYGTDNITLANFDTIIPDNVFKDVTGISLDQFRFLRDGGPYFDENTKKEEIFGGKLFDEIVFNDSVKEFLNMKKKLADYFDENATEDIFDYIPPQKTNQIFTPKEIVKKMVDMLEDENPGCFDNPDKTFIDLYMKSGLYIAELVKRLYQSKKMKQLFPDSKKRLQHIFTKQVYGLAPTEIIYKIATNFVLGFDTAVEIKKHNLKLLDTLPYAKEGTLETKLDKIFGKE